MFRKILFLCLFVSFSLSTSRFDALKKMLIDMSSSDASFVICQNFSLLQTQSAFLLPPVYKDDICVAEYELADRSNSLNEAVSYLDRQFCSNDFLKAFLFSKATFEAKFYNSRGSLQKTKRYNQYNRPSCSLL